MNLQDFVNLGEGAQAPSFEADVKVPAPTDLSGFYTKTDIDGKFTSYYTKAQGDGLLAGKLSLTGGTLSGQLGIQNGGPVLSLTNTGTGATRHVHHDGTWIGFLGSDGGWRWRVNDGGQVWTSQLGDMNDRIESRASAWANDAVSRAAANTENRAAAFADDRSNRCVQSSQAAGYVEASIKTGSGGSGDINNSGYFICRIYKSGVEQINAASRQPQLYIPNRGWFAAFPF